MNSSDKNEESRTRWKPTRDEINDILRGHEAWIKSQGQGGQRAELYHADLSGADLRGVDLRGARFSDTFFYNADLSESDFTQASGLQVEYLAGANLSGAIMPDDVDPVDVLDKTRYQFGVARFLFWVELILLLLSWIALTSISDANLLSRIYILPSIQISSVWFFGVMPILLLLGFILMQLRMQKSWKTIALLPKIFPDDDTLENKINFWFVHRLIRPYLNTDNGENSFVDSLKYLLIYITIWWLAPVTIIWYWLRFLTVHSWVMSGYHLMAASVSILSAFYFKALMKKTFTTRSKIKDRAVLRLVYTIITLSIFFVITLAVIEAVPPGVNSGFFALAPKIANFLGYNIFPDFSNGEISKKPADWSNDESQIVSIKGVDLSDLDAPYSIGKHAFLVNCNLSFAKLKYSILDSADLRGINLTGARLDSASLIGADLSLANLSGTNLTGANLYGAQFIGVTNLTLNTLRSARNWLYASFGGDIIDSLHLPPNHNENIAARDLSGYDLSGADFRGIDLSGFNLTGADFQNANLTNVNISGSNIFLTDLRGAIGLDKEKLQTALNWFFALYDESLLAELGLPVNHVELVEKMDFRTYNFEGLNISGANFKNANLRKVNMAKAILRNVNLQNADMYAVDLAGADLTGADFRSAVLLDTDISGANLSEVKNLTMDQVRWTIYDSTTIFPDYLRDAAAERLKNKH